MSTFTCFSPSSKSTNFDTNLTPVQSGAAIALGFGLSASAVAAKFHIHRSTIHNWLKIPAFFAAAETCRAEFETQFRNHLAMLTRLALNNIREILTNPDTSPSVRLKAALAVLKQDWKLPHSTDFDTNSKESDSLRNEMPPDSPDNQINDLRNEMPPDCHEPAPAAPEPIRSVKIGRNEPCPCGSNLKYKRCCGK
ncbi:MAG: SEC-C domain-containing protein [Bryobacterales bacterium]|nr:SEC-C domain-containing protein [Bryobacterales bacterium]